MGMLPMEQLQQLQQLRQLQQQALQQQLGQQHQFAMPELQQQQQRTATSMMDVDAPSQGLPSLSSASSGALHTVSTPSPPSPPSRSRPKRASGEGTASNVPQDDSSNGSMSASSQTSEAGPYDLPPVPFATTPFPVPDPEKFLQQYFQLNLRT